MADYAALIEKAAERMQAANDEMDSYLTLTEERALNEDEQAEYDTAKAAFERAKENKAEYQAAQERAQLAASVEAKVAPKGKAEERITHVGHEEIYRPDVHERSFFSDWLVSQQNPMSEAAERLRQHEAMQERANASGDFTIPGYIVEDVSLYTGRPFANVLPKYQLTSNILTDYQLTTGVQVAPQVTEADEFNDSSITWSSFNFYATTIAGEWKGSLQLLELNNGGFTDASVFSQLVKSYNQKVENYVFNGRGHTTYSELPGLLVISGTNAVTFNSGATPPTPTLAILRDAVAHAKIKVANGIGDIADTAVVSPGVFEWMSQQTDTTGRDLFTYSNQFPMNTAGPNSNAYEGARTTWMGLNWIASAALTGKNKIVVCAKDEIHMHEANGGVPTTLRLDQVLANKGQTMLVARNYVALNSERRKAAISIISGNNISAIELS